MSEILQFKCPVTSWKWNFSYLLNWSLWFRWAIQNIQIQNFCTYIMRLFCIFVSIFKTINYFTNFLSFLLVNKHVCWRRLVSSTWLQNPVFFIWNGVSFHWFGDKFLVILWTYAYRWGHPGWFWMGVLSVQVFGYNSFKLLAISMDVLTGKSSAVRLI